MSKYEETNLQSAEVRKENQKKIDRLQKDADRINKFIEDFANFMDEYPDIELKLVFDEENQEAKLCVVGKLLREYIMGTGIEDEIDVHMNLDW